MDVVMLNLESMTALKSSEVKAHDIICTFKGILTSAPTSENIRHKTGFIAEYMQVFTLS